MKLLFLYNKYYITIIQRMGGYYYEIKISSTASTQKTVYCASNPISNTWSGSYYSSLYEDNGTLKFSNSQSGTWDYYWFYFNPDSGTENTITFNLSGNYGNPVPTGLVGFMYICGQGGQGGKADGGGAGGGGAGGSEIYIDTLSTLSDTITVKLYDTSVTTNSSYSYNGKTITVGNGTNGSSGTSTNGGAGGKGGSGGSGGLSASNGYHYYFGGSGGGGGAGGSGGSGGLANTYGGTNGTSGTSTSNGLGYSTAVYFPDGTTVSGYTSASATSNQHTVGIGGDGGASGADGSGGNSAECMLAIWTPS